MTRIREEEDCALQIDVLLLLLLVDLTLLTRGHMTFVCLDMHSTAESQIRERYCRKLLSLLHCNVFRLHCAVCVIIYYPVT